MPAPLSTRSARRNAIQLDRSTFTFEFDASRFQGKNVTHIVTPASESGTEQDGENNDKGRGQQFVKTALGFSVGSRGFSVSSQGSGGAMWRDSTAQSATRPILVGRSVRATGRSGRHVLDCLNSSHVRVGSTVSNHVQACSYSEHHGSSSCHLVNSSSFRPRLGIDSTSTPRSGSVSFPGPGPSRAASTINLEPTSRLVRSGRPVTPRARSESTMLDTTQAPTVRARRTSYQPPKVARFGVFIGRRPGTAGGTREKASMDLSDGRAGDGRATDLRDGRVTATGSASLGIGTASAKEVEIKSNWSSSEGGSSAADVTGEVKSRWYDEWEPAASKNRSSISRLLSKFGRSRATPSKVGAGVCVGDGRATLGPCVGGGNESGSRVTGGALASRCKSKPNHEPRMLSRSGSAHESARRAPPRPPPSGPVPATPDYEFALPADRRQREATIRPTHSARGSIDQTLLKALQNGAPPDTTRYRDSITDDSSNAGSDHEDIQYDDIPPGTATTADDARVASHRPHPSLSSRAPITEANIRWSAVRSRSGSTASASAWRGASVYEERDDEDQDDYGVPSPGPADPDGMMSPGEYGGIVGPRRDLYSDDELESIEENECESLSDGDREDRTAAMIIADEGRGQIVDAEGRSVSELEVQPGTTHLLLTHNPTPALLPAFVAQVLPQISSTLLCLDISQNNLAALPPALSACTHLEELNVSFNPLRSLPSSLGALVSLRVLIADACELTNLPTQLINLAALHSLSVRFNRLVMLPVWMCAMPSLEVLKIEGNAFAGPWRAIVDPLLPRDLSPVPSPMVANGIYGASRAANSLPLLSSTSNGSLLASPIILSANLDDGRPGGPPQRSYSAQPQLGVAPGAGWGIRPNTAHSFGSSPSPGLIYPTSASAPHSPPTKSDALLPPPPMPVMSPPLSAGGGSTGLAHLHLPSLGPPAHPPSTAAALNMHLGALAPTQRVKKPKKKRGGGSISGSEVATTDAESEVEGRYGESITSWASRSVTSPRRMKSADELRRMGAPSEMGYDDSAAPPSAPIMTTAPSLPEPQGSQVKRYMSLGVRSGSARPDARHMWGGTEGRASRNSTGPRGSRYSARTSGLQAQPVDEDEVSPDVSYEFGGSDEGRGISRARSDEAGGHAGFPRSDEQLRFPRSDEQLRFPRSDEQAGSRFSAVSVEDAYAHSKSATSSPEEHRRKGRWGFLKKVSMGRLRSHSNAERLGRLPPAQVGTMPEMPERKDAMSPPPPAPQPITMAMGGAAPPRVDVTSAGSPASSVLTARLQHKASRDGLNGSTSPGLLQPTAPRAKRRSFLPFDTPPTLNIPIPSAEPFMPSVVALGTEGTEDEEAQRRADEEAVRVQLALRGVMSYLRDMADLEGAGFVPSPRNGRRPPLPQYADGRTKSDGSYASSGSTPPMLRSAPSTASLRGGQDSVNTTDSSGSYGQGFAEDRKYKDDKGRRAAIVREIVETEKSYVKGLQELLDIYVKPSSEPAPGLNVNKETTIPAQERKIVFTGVDALLQFHKMSFLPSLVGAAEILQTGGEDTNGQISTRAAHAVANVFVSHAAFMKMYFTYINNFDNAIQRLQFWSAPPSAPNTPGSATPATPASGTVGVGLSIAMGVAGVAPDQPPHAATLNAGQRKRIKAFLKRARLHPRHSQLNLEGYLLLPIQRIPRYKMLLDNLVTCTPPSPEARDDPLERALEEIAVLASSMNEGKRESESRTKLVQWQSRIRGKFISPLVQPHRRLIMDGRLQLVRLVKKVNSRAEVANPDGTIGQVEVPCLSSDSSPKQLVAILCNDLLVLCKEPPVAEPNGQVELWAVLRMQTMAQPASIVSGNGLRLVDNKAILYFNTQSTSEALTWQRAINLHIPHSQ